ncbi:MAG TPA: hypothetical protein VMC02_04465 [Steroidobacteraceae bacterium]|nr:hypothetical protein [Steroidobacteraceae bacterium]
MPLPFESVREQLLRAGVTPRYTRRYVTELREHLADLIESGRAAGLGVGEASGRARLLMGKEADLASAAIEAGAPRSLAARAPMVMFVVLPLLLWAAVLCADIVSMMHLLWPVRDLTPGEMPERYRVLVALGGFTARYLIGLVLCAGCIAIAVRQRLPSGWIWVGLGLIAVVTGMLGIYPHVVPPEAGHPGGTLYSAVALVYVHGRVSLAATLGWMALHAAILFGLAAAAYHALRLRFELAP